jgi:hypothetical protein
MDAENYTLFKFGNYVLTFLLAKIMYIDLILVPIVI